MPIESPIAETISQAIVELLDTSVAMDTYKTNSVLRCYPQKPNQGEAMPNFHYAIEDSDLTRHMTGASNLFEDTFQFVMDAETYEEAIDLHDAIHVSLDGYAGQIDYIDIRGIFFGSMNTEYVDDGRGRDEGVHTVFSRYTVWYRKTDSS